MTAWHSIRLVAAREIKERGRSKPFLITSVITALLVIGIIVLPGFFSDDTE
ncbi:MAG: ABC transporter permease, partial [Actinobacteria bacterium]